MLWDTKTVLLVVHFFVSPMGDGNFIQTESLMVFMTRDTCRYVAGVVSTDGRFGRTTTECKEVPHAP